MERLKGKVAVITGSSQGIGLAIARRLGKEGANVVINSRQNERAEEIAAFLVGEGIDSCGIGADVSLYEEARKLVDAVLDHWGGLDILVNNAGVTKDTLLMRMSETDWDLVINTNLKGAFNMCRSAVRSMTKKRWGRIINISSVAGLSGNLGQANYAAAKAGLTGFTKTLARELGSRNITANVIAPGLIETEMSQSIPVKIKEAMLQRIALQRYGKSDDVASLAAFLASEEAAYITGQVLVVDGGLAL